MSRKGFQSEPGASSGDSEKNDGNEQTQVGIPGATERGATNSKGTNGIVP